MNVVNVSKRVVCAANRMSKDNVIILGARHFDHLMHKGYVQYCKSLNIDEDNEFLSKQWRSSEQGFINTHGEFLTREEAFVVAEVNNQIIRRVGGDNGVLYSENLY